MTNTHKAVGDVRTDSMGDTWPLAILGVGDKWCVVNLARTLKNELLFATYYDTVSEAAKELNNA